MSVVVPLTTPIQAHGKTLSELTLRAPKGSDIAACGLPRTFVFKGDATSLMTNTGAIHTYIVRLGNIPPSSADALSASDWMSVMSVVLDFFAPAGPATSDPMPDATPLAGITIPFQGITT